MTDPVPSKESDTPKTDAAVWYAELDSMPQIPVVDAEIARELEREIKRLRTTLRGVQSCSTCEACRGAATLALRGTQPKPAHEREMPHCSTCSCPPYQAPDPGTLLQDGRDYLAALKIVDAVFEQYRKDQSRWWRKMDGTPILNDVPVRIAEAFARSWGPQKRAAQPPGEGQG